MDEVVVEYDGGFENWAAVACCPETNDLAVFRGQDNISSESLVYEARPKVGDDYAGRVVVLVLDLVPGEAWTFHGPTDDGVWRVTRSVDAGYLLTPAEAAEHAAGD